MNTEFVESRQACDKASSWCRQDPTRLMIASDTQAGRERNTKMAAACSICLHDAMCDVSVVVVKDILNKTFFPHSSVTKIKQGLFFLFLCRSSLLSLCPPPPPPPLCFQQRPERFGETKAPLVLFDLSIMMSMIPDGLTTQKLGKHRIEDS